MPYFWRALEASSTPLIVEGSPVHTPSPSAHLPPPNTGQNTGTIFGQKAEDLLSLTAVKLLEHTSEAGAVDITYLDTSSTDKKHIFNLKASYHQQRNAKMVKFVVMSVHDAPTTPTAEGK